MDDIPRMFAVLLAVVGGALLFFGFYAWRVEPVGGGLLVLAGAVLLAGALVGRR